MKSPPIGRLPWHLSGGTGAPPAAAAPTGRSGTERDEAAAAAAAAVKVEHVDRLLACTHKARDREGGSRGRGLFFFCSCACASSPRPTLSRLCRVRCVYTPIFEGLLQVGGNPAERRVSSVESERMSESRVSSESVESSRRAASSESVE